MSIENITASPNRGECKNIGLIKISREPLEIKPIVAKRTGLKSLSLSLHGIGSNIVGDLLAGRRTQNIETGRTHC
jgi:hypothetical protein